jgi:hypothetical protein
MAGKNLVSRHGWEITKSLLIHRGWCGWYEGSWIDFRMSMSRRVEKSSSFPHEWLRIFCEVL